MYCERYSYNIITPPQRKKSRQSYIIITHPQSKNRQTTAGKFVSDEQAGTLNICSKVIQAQAGIRQLHWRERAACFSYKLEFDILLTTVTQFVLRIQFYNQAASHNYLRYLFSSSVSLTIWRKFVLSVDHAWKFNGYYTANSFSRVIVISQK